MHYVLLNTETGEVISFGEEASPEYLMWALETFDLGGADTVVVLKDGNAYFA